MRAINAGLQRLETLLASVRLIWEMHALLKEGVRSRPWTPVEFWRTHCWIGSARSTKEGATCVPPLVASISKPTTG